ncbi:hypothetical protein ACLKA6_013419 [Drosophila palustris]
MSTSSEEFSGEESSSEDSSSEESSGDESSSDDYDSSDYDSSDYDSSDFSSDESCEWELTKKMTSFNLAGGLSSSTSSRDNDLLNAICSCTSCSARKQSMITEDTVFMIEFEIKDIKRDKFPDELVKCCRRNSIDGYVIYSSDRTEAKGIMEGEIEDLNVVKNWIKLSTDGFIADPLEINIYLSCFLIATNPTKCKFREVEEFPIEEEQSNDFSSNFGSV